MNGDHGGAAVTRNRYIVVGVALLFALAGCTGESTPSLPTQSFPVTTTTPATPVPTAPVQAATPGSAAEFVK